MKGKSISPFLLLYIAFILFLPGKPARGEEFPYVAELISLAKKKQLAKDAYWLTLLHYRKTLFGARSVIDDPRFFLSPQGGHDAQAELEATIRAFFEKQGDERDPAICRFIARYSWLKECLDIDASRLPVSECTKFNETVNAIKPKSLTVVFPTAFMNNPASLFGHTLLNIETTSKSKLLSHAINYSAFTRERNGLVFALKGLFGFYKGNFSIRPYYDKVQEYNDICQRDIWEYSLNFNEEEVKRMVMHLWELQEIFSYYYFFDENCSYNLLFLLDAARPSLALIDQFKGWVIPIDTIKTFYASGLIEQASYRPSQATEIRYIGSLLHEDGQKKAIALAMKKIAPAIVIQESLPQEEKRKIFDLAVDWVLYRYVKKDVTKDEYTSLFLTLLKARSSLGKSDDPRYEPPEPPRPEEGHDSHRIGIGFGIRNNETFQEIRYRPAYHDLLDDDKGYDRGSQIQFCNTIIRYYFSERKVQVKKVDLIDIISLSPRDIFFKPFSWKVTTGLIQKTMKDKDDHLIYHLNTGGGLAFDTKFAGLVYGMAEADGAIGGTFRKNYAAGLGGSVGFKQKLTDFWHIHVRGRALYYGLGDNHADCEAAFSQNFSLGRNRSLRTEISRSRTFGVYRTDAVLSWNFYF